MSMRSSSCNKSEAINPLTGRKIVVGGPTFRNLLQEGYVYHQHLLTPIDMAMLRAYQDPNQRQPDGLVGKTAVNVEGKQSKDVNVMDWIIQPRIFADSTTVSQSTMIEEIRRELLFVDKPSGLNSVPARDPTVPSLSCMLEEIYTGIKPCHRLDRDTSGVLVFGRNPSAHRFISQQFANHEHVLQKTYIALVEGHIQEDSGVIDIPIGKTPQTSLNTFRQWTVEPGAEKSRPAKTSWVVLERYNREGALYTRVKLLPHTGRGHQLRLHMKYLGHCILGDSIHAPDSIAMCAPRLCLHAESLQVEWYSERLGSNDLVIGSTDVPF